MTQGSSAAVGAEASVTYGHPSYQRLAWEGSTVIVMVMVMIDMVEGSTVVMKMMVMVMVEESP